MTQHNTQQHQRSELPPLSSMSMSMASLTTDRSLDSSSRAAYQFHQSSLDGVPMLDGGSQKSDLADIMSSKRNERFHFETAAVINARRTPSSDGHQGHHQHQIVHHDAKSYSSSLREDLEPVQLFSRAYAALALNGFASGFAITFLRYVFRPLLVAYLSLHHRNQFLSARYLLEWPAAFAVFVGLLSDCVPIGGYHRKSYMVLGWFTSFLMFTGIVVATLLSPSKILLFVDTNKPGEAIATSDLETYPEQFAVLYVTFAVIGCLGFQVAYVVSLAMTVELAQREPLYMRGHLQAMYMFLFYLAALLAQFFASKVLFMNANESEPLRSTITMGEAGVVLSMCSVAAFPTALFFLTEERVLMGVPCDEDDEENLESPNRVPSSTSSNSSTLSLLAERVRELFHFSQQQVVYRVVGFVCGIVLILGLYNQNLRDAVALWSDITPQKTLGVQVAQNACIVLGIMIWRGFLVNTSWQRLVIVSVCFYVLCCMALTLPTVYGWYRNEWYFLVLTALLEVPKGLFKLFAVLPATEIAELGREGVTVGLLFSFQWLVYIAANTLSTALSKGIGTNVTTTQVLADSADTRSTLITAATVYYSINLFSIMLAVMLPEQKLQAQQMRASGKQSRAMGYTIMVGFWVLLVYGLVANIIAIQNGE